jgi:hypothetical protein
MSFPSIVDGKLLILHRDEKLEFRFILNHRVFETTFIVNSTDLFDGTEAGMHAPTRVDEPTPAQLPRFARDFRHQAYFLSCDSGCAGRGCCIGAVNMALAVRVLAVTIDVRHTFHGLAGLAAVLARRDHATANRVCTLLGIRSFHLILPCPCPSEPTRPPRANPQA